MTIKFWSIITFMAQVFTSLGFATEVKLYRSLGKARVSSYANGQKVHGRYMSCENLRDVDGFDSKIAPYYLNSNQYIFINGDAGKALFYSLARTPEAVKKWMNPNMESGHHTLSLKVTQDYVGLHNTCCLKQRERVNPFFGDAYYSDKEFICHIFMSIPETSLKDSHKDLD